MDIETKIIFKKMIKEFLFWAILLIFFTILAAIFTGCSGTGFEKQATLMPDDVGITVGAWQYAPNAPFSPGVNINATWNLK